MKVLITSPHYICNNMKSKDLHLCDFVSDKVANMLAKFNNCIYFPGDISRDIVDLNRKESRNTFYRKKIRTLFKIKKIDIIIDIHSFPPDRKGLVSVGFCERNEIIPEIVLLLGPLDMINNKKIGRELYKQLKNYNIIVNIVPNIKVLDILNEAAEHNIPGIVLEFCENINDDRMSFICNIIMN